MSRWVFGAGLVLVVLGVAMLSPLVDLLPVGVLGGAREGTVYLRIVPTAESRSEAAALVLLVSGSLVLLVGCIVRRREGSG